MLVGAMDCNEIQVKQPSLVRPSTTSGGGVQERLTLTTRVRMSCRSASKVLAAILAVLLLILCWSSGSSAESSVVPCSSSDSIHSVSLLPIAASSAVLVGGKRVLCAFSVALYNPGLVLLLSLSVATAAAAVVVPVVVVVVGELVLLLASPIT